MEPYNLNVAVILACCFFFYKLFLNKETYYQLNRIVLLTCMIVCFLLPLVPVPGRLFEQRTPTTDYVFFSKQSEKTMVPLNLIENRESKPLSTTVPIKKPFLILKDIIKYAGWIYWFGVIAFSLNFIIQLIKLIYMSYGKPVIRDGRYRIVEIDKNIGPCSFAKSIFINPSKYDFETFNQIIVHEKVHIHQVHTIDLLLSEIMLIFQWFNPFAWFYRKEVEQNLEFLTDHSVLQHSDIPKTEYQMSLLKVCVPNLSMRIVTNYNQSLLTKRLKMMNAKTSNVHSIWKYLFLIPLFTILAIILNKPVAAGNPLLTRNSPNMSNLQINEKTDQSQGLWFAVVKGNNVEVEFKSKDTSFRWSNTIIFSAKDFPLSDQGTNVDYSLSREPGTLKFKGQFSNGQGYGEYNFIPDENFSAFLKSQGLSPLNINQSFAFFTSDIKKEYVLFLKSSGIVDLTSVHIITLAVLNVDASYLNYWKKLGFPHLSTDEIVSMKTLNIDSSYVNSIKKQGHPDVTINQLIRSKYNNVSFVNNNKNIPPGTNAQVRVNIEHDANILSAKAIKNTTMQADSNYVLAIDNSSNKKQYKLIPINSVPISQEFVDGFTKIGYTGLTKKTLCTLKLEGISPDYIKSFEDIGYKRIPINDFIILKMYALTADDVQGFHKLGYEDILLSEAIRLKVMGITPAYVAAMTQKGFKYSDLYKYRELKNLSTNSTVTEPGRYFIQVPINN